MNTVSPPGSTVEKKPLPQASPALKKFSPAPIPAQNKPAAAVTVPRKKTVLPANSASGKPASTLTPLNKKTVLTAGTIQKPSALTGVASSKSPTKAGTAVVRPVTKVTPVQKKEAAVSSQVIKKEQPTSNRGGIIGLLPKAFQEVCQKNLHLVEYLNKFPVSKYGIPEYYTEPTRKLGDLDKKNLIYPVSDDVFVHILSSPEEARDSYISIQPSNDVDAGMFLDELERKLVGLTDKFTDIATEDERKKLVLSLVNKICEDMAKGNSSSSIFNLLSRKDNKDAGKIKPTPRQIQAVKYLAYRDKVGMGVLDPMIKDKNIEDISCSGLGTVFVEHKIFKSLKSSLIFSDHDDLDQFVVQLSERIKKPVTLRNPIIDAVLPDGSRINIVYGKEISKRGSNFSIRKFADTPLSILELVEFKSLNYTMAAYLSIVIEEGMNLFVSGETASGKTTLLNALTCFVPTIFKIISIEDTPELQVPHKNWLREVSKMSAKGETGSDVGMFDLLKAALRQRPNLIIIGEIRGEEGNIAFQAMQTGHQAMATFHASTVEKLIQRLTGSPINVPKSYIDNLNVAVIQNQVRLANGKLARRCQSINEIIGYDSVANSFSFIEIFRWDPLTDTFEFVGNKNSFLLEEKIALRKGLPPSKKWLIYDELERRTRVLEKIHKSGGISGFYELLEVLATAKKEGLF